MTQRRLSWGRQVVWGKTDTMVRLVTAEFYTLIYFYIQLLILCVRCIHELCKASDIQKLSGQKKEQKEKKGN